jgi:iron complex transport system ATP-binding protein
MDRGNSSGIIIQRQWSIINKDDKMENKLLTVDNLNFGYSGNKFSLSDVSFSVDKKNFIGIIGRNGSGKSTLVKIIAGIYKNYNGTINYKRGGIEKFNERELAKIISYLPQSDILFFEGLKVYDLLLMGRYAYKNFSSFTYNSRDKEIVNKSIEITGIGEYKDKSLLHLSGGEKQKVLITLALVQLDITSELSEKILIIDEPLTFLDINYQFEIFSILSKLNTEKDLTIIIVTHNLNLALQYTNKILLLENGKIAELGDPKKIINEETLKKYFLINSQILNIDDEYYILTNTK